VYCNDELWGVENAGQTAQLTTINKEPLKTAYSGKPVRENLFG
jgi:hypothetical protein